MPALMTGLRASAAPCVDAACEEAKALAQGRDALRAGNFSEAIATLRSGLDRLAATPGDPALQPLHTALGEVFSAQGDLAEAAAHYEAALNLTPWSISALCDLAAIFFKMRRLDESATLYRAALHVDPRHWPARINLALTLRSARRFGECKSLLLELAAEQPNNGFVYNQLGKLHALGGEFEAALGFFQQAAGLDPLDSDSIFWIGGVKQAMGDIDGAKADYARAAKIKPLFKQPARQSPPAFSVLLLCAPATGNTPVAYITGQSAYETQLLLLLPDVSYDASLLRRSGHILFNIVSDADQAGQLLALASDLADSIGLPVINHPRTVQQTARDIVAGRLQSIEGARTPRTVRHAASAGAPVEALQPVIDMSFPLLARPAGTHGGDAFEKIHDWLALSSFIERHPGTDRYLIEYIDYASPDGYFRKYRFIFVDDEILPYHLAIGQDWKVHHATTDMINHAWMQDEERAFLEDPRVFFNARQYDVLHAIQKTVDLDYFGIDCGLDRAGNVVVFEVNASMLVHQNNQRFPYKTPFVRNIKEAFDNMLAKRRVSL
jgi:tetratricopeptide (TPR) repeat protein